MSKIQFISFRLASVTIAESAHGQSAILIPGGRNIHMPLVLAG